MTDAVWSQQTPTSDLSADVGREVRRRLMIARCLRDDVGLRAWALRRCSESVDFFVDNFVWCGSPELGRPVPAIRWDFQSAASACYLGLDGYVDPSGRRQPMIVVKSRETGGSFVILRSMLWEWLFRSYRTHVVMSLKEDEVDDARATFDSSLFGKLRFMLQRLPLRMLPREYRTPGKARGLDSMLRLVNPETGSIIVGLSTSADGMRGKRGVRVFIDEANAIPFLPAALEAASAVGPVCMLSSVKGRHSHFARVWHGEGGIDIGSRGSWGIVPFRWSYADRPDRDPQTEHGRLWRESKRRSVSEDAWQQEYECDFCASLPARIWGEWLRPSAQLSPSEWLDDWQPHVHEAVISEGWDFGRYAYTAWVIVAWWPATDEYAILDYGQWADGIASEIGEFVGRAGYHSSANPRGRVPSYRVGDPAGKSRGTASRNGRRLREVGTWLDNLRSDAGIQIYGQHIELESAREYVRAACREERMYLSPSCCRRRQDQPKRPSPLEVIQGYHYDVSSRSQTPEDHVGASPEPAKDHYSHLADAIQHAVWAIETRARQSAVRSRQDASGRRRTRLPMST